MNLQITSRPAGAASLPRHRATKAKGPTKKPMPAWAKCPCCDDFLCAIHGKYVHDCSCPDLEDWDSKLGLIPYSEGGNLTPEALAALCKEHGVGMN